MTFSYALIFFFIMSSFIDILQFVKDKTTSFTNKLHLFSPSVDFVLVKEANAERYIMDNRQQQLPMAMSVCGLDHSAPQSPQRTKRLPKSDAKASIKHKDRVN